MKIILDTHIFLWALAEPARISVKRLDELQLISNIVYVSSITVTELMIKSSIGKIEVPIDPVETAIQSGFEMLDYSGADALLLRDLPFHHKDPFDRMLIAQSLSRKIPIMTDDRKFSSYDCKVI